MGQPRHVSRGMPLKQPVPLYCTTTPSHCDTSRLRHVMTARTDNNRSFSVHKSRFSAITNCGDVRAYVPEGVPTYMALIRNACVPLPMWSLYRVPGGVTAVVGSPARRQDKLQPELRNGIHAAGAKRIRRLLEMIQIIRSGRGRTASTGKRMT